MIRVVSVTAGLVFLGTIASLTAADEKPKVIKDVMALHKKDQLRQQVQADLKEAAPDWTVVQKKTKTYAAQAKELMNFEPPKGDKESFKKLAKSFSDSINDLDKAAQAKDAKAATGAFQKSGTYCMMCHQAHRP